MKHLFLHVGMQKTGTTSIQFTFFANRALLAEQGLHYLDAARSHSGLMETAFGAGTTGASLPPRAVAARDKVARFLGQPEAGRFVISGEDMCRMEAEEIRGLLGFVRPLVDRVTVVCFVRPPRGYLTSSVQQGIRAGTPLRRLRVLAPPNYRNQIGKFLDCADLADTVLTLHHRAALVRGCSIAAMLDICGAAPDLYDRLALKQENTSLSRDGATLLLALAEAGLPGKRRAGAAPDRAWRQHALRFANALPGPRFAIPPALVESALSAPEVLADLRWAEERLGRPFPESAAVPPPDEAEAAAGWPENELTQLSRAAVDELVMLLGNEATRLRRTPAGLAFARLQGWLEGRLEAAGLAPGGPLPRSVLADLAGRLIATLAEMVKLRAAATDQPAPTAESPGSSAAA
jgi:hypothetical protein